jgi:hypothetical protein
MADYYPLIHKAVAGLDPDAPGESRRALYERARTALITQLRNISPPFTEAEITRERLELEEAVRKVEGEAAQRGREARVRSFRDPVPADADAPGQAAAETKRRDYVRPANSLANPWSPDETSIEVPSMIISGAATGRLTRFWRWRSSIRQHPGSFAR